MATKRYKTKLKVGDIVKVLSGKYKGALGAILKIQQPKQKPYKQKKNLRVKVEGVNLVKKHQRKTQDKPGEIIAVEAFMDISKVAILNPTTQKQDKIQYKFLEDGRKVRIFASSGDLIHAEGAA